MSSRITDPYLLAGLAGFVLAALVIVFLAKKQPYLKFHLFLEGVSAIAGMFIGAHLLFFIVELPDFVKTFAERVYDFQSFLNAFGASASGMVFYGGLYGAILGIIIYSRSFRIPARPYLNIISVVFPLFHAFGRLGCALTGCCYGIEYHGVCAIQYTEAVINPGVNDHIVDFPRFPVQPLEAICELILFAILLIIYIKSCDRYSIIAIYLFVYGIIRFFDEFLRGDVLRGFWGPFSTSQWIALFSIIRSGIYFIVYSKDRRNL